MGYGFLADFVEETCTGTGDVLTLAGATTGNRRYGQAFADGDFVAYVVKDADGTNIASGIGKYASTGDTITRNDMSTWNGTTAEDYPSANLTLSGGTHTVSCNITNQILISMTGSNLAPYPDGKTFARNVKAWSGISGAAMTPDRQQFVTLHFDHPMEVTGMSVRCTTVQSGGTTGYLGITRLSNECVHSDYIHQGSVDLSTTGAKTVAFNDVILPGWYGVHFLSPSNHSMECAGGINYLYSLTKKCADFNSRNSIGHVMYKNSVTGGLDPDPNTLTSTNFNNSYFPAFWFET